jgi:hypothetical protein
MRALFVAVALCVASGVMAQSVDRHPVDETAPRYGLVKRDARPVRETVFGTLATDLIRDLSTGREWLACEVTSGGLSQEADCLNGRPQR